MKKSNSFWWSLFLTSLITIGYYLFIKESRYIHFSVKGRINSLLELFQIMYTAVIVATIIMSFIQFEVIKKFNKFLDSE